MSVSDSTPAADHHGADFSIAMHTDIGARQTNQDRADYCVGDHGLIMVLGDGLGGHEGGELAAETFVNSVVWTYKKHADKPLENPYEFIVSSVVNAHHAIIRSAATMGYNAYSPKTTGVICVIQDGFAYWGHIGDSRLYHYRAGALRERTLDHTPTEQQRQRGLIGEDDMRLAQYQSSISRCIGGRRRSIVTLGEEIALERGDLILMCTDGFWRAFDNRALYQKLSKRALEQGLESMTREARKLFRQQCDNVTVIGLRWHRDSPAGEPRHPHRFSDDEQASFWKQSNDDDDSDRELVSIDDNADRPEAKQRLLDEITDFDQAIDDLEKFVDKLSR